MDTFDEKKQSCKISRHCTFKAYQQCLSKMILSKLELVTIKVITDVNTVVNDAQE
jgi:hypothetical protein